MPTSLPFGLRIAMVHFLRRGVLWVLAARLLKSVKSPGWSRSLLAALFGCVMKKHLSFVVALVILVSQCGQARADGESPPVPSAEELAKAEAMVKELYQKE